MPASQWLGRSLGLAMTAAILAAAWPAGARGAETASQREARSGETAGHGEARSGETAGMITEIKNGRGRVEVRTAGGAEWRPAAPLQTLRAGDAVRATADARAVVVLSGGRGSVKVQAAGSPYLVPLPRPGESKTQKALGLLESSLNYLSSGTKEPLQAVLSTRGASRPPVILSPRNTAVLPDPLAFEWLGSRFARYAVKVVGPAGPVLERAGVVGARFAYPADAPALAPGVRYTLQVVSGQLPPQEAWFEVVDAGRAQAVRRDLAELEQALGPTPSPSTLAALRAGFLASNGLYHNARLVVTAALAADPDEPTLHLLLANLYGKTGLPDQAAESYDEAQFLMTRGASEPPPAQR